MSGQATDSARAMPKGDSDQDGLAVFCLSPTHRSDLVDAATILGLVKPGSASAQVTVTASGQTLALQAWRAQHPTDFQRACTALAAAQKPADQLHQSALLDSVGTTLLPLVAGALITALAGEWVGSSSRGREAAIGIRTTTDAASRAVEDYLAVWFGGGGDEDQLATAVQSRFDDIRAKLDPLLVRRRYRHAAQAVLTLLREAPLGDELTRGWRRPVDHETRRDGIEERLRALAQLSNTLALALESPHRPHPSLRSLTRKAVGP